MPSSPKASVYAASPLYVRLLLTPGSATTLDLTSDIAPLATASVAQAAINASSPHGALSWSSVTQAGREFSYTLTLPGGWGGEQAGSLGSSDWARAGHAMMASRSKTCNVAWAEVITHTQAGRAEESGGGGYG